MLYTIYFPLMMFAAAIINAPIITEHISIVTQIAAIVLLFNCYLYIPSGASNANPFSINPR